MDIKKTLANLQAAFNGESNAGAKYAAFAKTAAAEGYLGVARLFEAACKAEEFHARNHAQVIRSLGGVPKADIQTPAPGDTRANLAAAIAGETYERDVMYPGFVEEARTQKIAAAVRTFSLALKVEAEHAALYQAALDNLDAWKAARQFLVCTVCGSTMDGKAPPRCGVCGAPAEKFITVG
jgi:rubrerythrin